MKTIISLSLLSTGLCFAQSLPMKQVENIRAGLSIRSDMQDLSKVLETTIREETGTVSLSFYFKQLLSNKAESLKLGTKYGSLVPLDPSLSLEQYDEKIELTKVGICYQTLVNQEGGLDPLLIDIMFNFAPKEAQEKSRSRQRIAEKLKIVELIQAHLEKAPQSEEGQSISSVLGKLSEVNLRKNRIRSLRFDKDDLPLSLSSLISLRSGDDEVFVNLQECLVNYLKEQKNLFSNRWVRIDKGERIKSSAALFAEAQLKSKPLMPVQWSELAPTQVEAARLQFFMEGQQGFSDLQKEKDFLMKRMARIDASLKFLESRLQESKRINALAEKLSARQLDFLIDLMIQLNRDVLPTSASISMSSAAVQRALKGEDVEEFFYQRQIHRDLLTLSATMAESRRKEDAKKDDIKALQLR